MVHDDDSYQSKHAARITTINTIKQHGCDCYVKGKGHPITGHHGPRVRVEVSL
jgi:hypothetical protein